MICIDPEISRRLQEADDLDGAAWHSHLAACTCCRALFGHLDRIAAQDPVEIHPAATALAAYSEDPASLSPKTRVWITAHLATCTPCALALRAVPRLDAAARSHLRPWHLAAAAGWLLAALLGAAEFLRPDTEPFPVCQSLVLSTPRGTGAQTIRAEARFLRLHFVLGEETPLGTRLRVRFADGSGRTLFDREETVAELDERDWPVLTVDRRILPGGLLLVLVTTPSGLEARFELRG